jgi:hypothetical protein
LKSVSRIRYIQVRRWKEGVTWRAGQPTASWGVEEDFAMTIELFYLTTQIQRWLNLRVARHLAAQAERLTR